MTKEELNIILENHHIWLRGDGGCRADLCGADLRDADLKYANLCRANLSDANLSNANLYQANLSDADLCRANLSGANLSFANLSCSDLSSAYLYKADLYKANLSDADLQNADLCEADLHFTCLYNADLYCADLSDTHNIFIPTTCPETGSFIGYKKAIGYKNFAEDEEYIVELEILSDALRCSATGRKCRCNKAKVLSIQNIDGSIADLTCVHSRYDSRFVYTIGEIVEAPNFNPNRLNECSAGIHFFINRQEAVDY